MCFCNFQGQKRWSRYQQKPKHTGKKKKTCTVHAPSVSFVLVFQTLACREDSKAQAHSSQAGDKMLVRSEVFKSSPIAKGWEISPVLFILFYAAVFRYFTDARMQFPSFGTCFAVEQVKKIWCPQGNPPRAGLYFRLLSQWIYFKNCDPFSEAAHYALQISWRKKRLHLRPKQKNSTYRQISPLVIQIQSFPHSPSIHYNICSHHFTPLWKSLLT